MGETVAGDFVARGGEAAQILRVIKNPVVHGAAAEAAGGIISGAHLVPGQDGSAPRPSRFGEVVEGDAGDGPPARQTHGPDRCKTGKKAVEADQGHFPI